MPKRKKEIVKTVKMRDGREINFVRLFEDKNRGKRKTIHEMSDKELAEMKKRLDLQKRNKKKFRR